MAVIIFVAFSILKDSYSGRRLGLPVRMYNRRDDAIPPICDIIIDVLVRYVLTVCLPVLSICTILCH